MSSVASLTGSSSELSLLQQLLARQNGTTGSTSSTSSLGTQSRQDMRRARFEADFIDAAVAAGLNSADVDKVEDEIKAAVTAVQQKSDGTTDQREATKNAIDGVLQKHGVDLKKFQSELQSSMGGAGGPPPGGPPPGGPGGADLESRFNDAAVAAGLDAGKTDELQSKIKSAIGQALENSDGSTDPRQTIQDAIDSLLKEYGVDLTKFKSLMQSTTNRMSGAIPLVDEKA